jgi:4'-phosphopantetheinyl transferase
MRCFLTDCSPLEDPGLYARVYGRLPAWRRERADFYRFPRDRHQSMVAGLYLGLVERGHGAISIGEDGKPRADGIEFNASHSGCYVAFACSEHAVGVDIESVGSNMDIARNVTTPDEYVDLMDCEDARQREDLFCRMWTAKESYMKAIGKGMGLPPETFRVLHGTEIASPSDDFAITELSPPRGYRVSVCCEEECCILEEIGIERLLEAERIEDLFRSVLLDRFEAHFR